MPVKTVYRYGYEGFDRESEDEREQRERFWRSLARRITRDPQFGRRTTR